MILDIHNNPNAYLLAEAYEKGLNTEITYYSDFDDTVAKVYCKVVGFYNNGVSLLVFNYTPILNKTIEINNKREEIEEDLVLGKMSLMYHNIDSVKIGIVLDGDLQKRINDFLVNRVKLKVQPNQEKEMNYEMIKDQYHYESELIKKAEREYNEAVALQYSNEIIVEEQYETLFQKCKRKLKELFGVR